MIKFEEHDDNLFRMLEEPVPLTDNAELPVLVRLIQDDTMLGKANKRSCHPDTLAQKIICSSSNLTDDGLFMDGNYTYCYEIIGTLVVEGSAEWAWYQMMQGEKVFRVEWECDMYCQYTNNEIITFRDGISSTINPVEEWIANAKRADSDWQIYKEPKSLLADAKVGDIVKTNLGDYLQIVDTPCLRFGHDECYRTHDGLYWDKCGVCAVDSTYRLVAVEPLAPEGTKEWAWQQMLLGNEVWNPKLDSHKTKRTMSQVLSIYYIDGGNIMVRNLSGERCVLGVQKDSHWTVYAEPTGWQIYKEPKEEPQYKVGDWVEVECQNKLYHKQVLFVTENRVGFEFSGTKPSVCFDGTPSHIFKFIRKLDPSEVVLDFGSGIKGTIVGCSSVMPIVKVLDGVDWIASIMITALDKETREIVESLLKAQDEEKQKGRTQ